MTELNIALFSKGTPQPEVRWFQHQNSTCQIKETPHFHIYRESAGVHTLLIKDANPFDLGSYTARVNNKYGQVETTCQVVEWTRDGSISIASNQSIDKGPKFVEDPPTNIFLKLGDDLVISCAVTGFPIPTGIIKLISIFTKIQSVIKGFIMNTCVNQHIYVLVNLYRGCRNVTLQPRAYREILEQTEELQRVRFTLSSVQCTDIGLYTIEAKNILSATKAFTNVKVGKDCR